MGVFEVVSVVPDPDASSPPGQGVHEHTAPIAPSHSSHTAVQSLVRNKEASTYAVVPIYHQHHQYNHTSDGGSPSNMFLHHYHTNHRVMRVDHASPYHHHHNSGRGMPTASHHPYHHIHDRGLAADHQHEQRHTSYRGGGPDHQHHHHHPSS